MGIFNMRDRHEEFLENYKAEAEINRKYREAKDREIELRDKLKNAQNVRRQSIVLAISLVDVVAKNTALSDVDVGEIVLKSAEKFTQYILDDEVKKERKKK